MGPPGRSGSLDATAMEARVRALSSDQRQYLVEGARHGEGRWDTARVIDTVDRAEHRDAVIWSVRFFVWKHMWQRAGEFMRGLNDPDVRRVATRLALTWDDLRAIADAQPEKAQQERLNVAFFTDLAFTAKIQKDLVGEKDAGRSVVAWLAKDDLVAPFAAAKWGTGPGPTAHVMPAEGWQDFYAARAKGRVDPATGETLSEEAARKRAVTSHGFTTQTEEIYLKAARTAAARCCTRRSTRSRPTRSTTSTAAGWTRARPSTSPAAWRPRRASTRPARTSSSMRASRRSPPWSATRSWPRPASPARRSGCSPPSTTPAGALKGAPAAVP